MSDSERLNKSLTVFVCVALERMGSGKKLLCGSWGSKSGCEYIFFCS